MPGGVEPESAAPEQQSASAPVNEAHECTPQLDADQHATQGAQAVSAQLQAPQQQPVQQRDQEAAQAAKESAPAAPTNPLCPALNLTFFTQAGASQLPSAGLARTGAQPDHSARAAPGETLDEAVTGEGDCTMLLTWHTRACIIKATQSPDGMLTSPCFHAE